MAVKSDKERVMISLTKAQLEQIDKAASEMGLTRSGLMGVATMQYISTFEISKDITKSALSDAIAKALKEGDIKVEQLRG